MSVNKTFLMFGLVAVGIIVAALVATIPPAGRLMAREQTTRRTCHTEQISLDQGYGVSRIVERRVCDDL